MTETKFQMFFQKIYGFIKFKSLYIEFFSIQILKKYRVFFSEILFVFFLFCVFSTLKRPTYLRVLSF